MKNIDIKSVIIGGLLTTTIIFGCAAAANKADKGKWDFKQKWIVDDFTNGKAGWEPFAVNSQGNVLGRKHDVR
jgi:hypothetical protein